MIWMCPIVDKIKNKFDEITNYYIEIEEDKKKIEEIANEILEYYNQDGNSGAARRGSEKLQI